MTRKNLITLGFIFGVLYGFYLFRDHSNQDATQIATIHKRNADDTQEMQETKIHARPPAVKSLSSIKVAEVASFRKSFPDKNAVKKEVVANPHRTPPSLISFAEKLGGLNEKALNNPEDAKILLSELHDCALDESVYSSSRALCISKADKLATLYPELKDKVDQIHSGASPDVMKLNNSQSLLLKKR